MTRFSSNGSVLSGHVALSALHDPELPTMAIQYLVSRLR